MRFISALLAGALAVVASAQTSSTGPNPFTNSDFTGIVAGEPFTITWDPTTEGTVTLQLVQGDPSALDTVETIEAGVDNSGSYTWTPDSSIVKGSDYALKIVDDSDEENYNYTTQFSIDSDVTESSAPTTAASTSTEALTSTEEPSTSTTEEPSTTSEETTATETTATETTSTDASSTTDSSSTEASTTTTSRPTTTSAAAETSSSVGAAATGGAKVGAGLMGFVGAAMLLL